MSTSPGPSHHRAAPRRPCPICQRPRRADFLPFCSARCRDLDLARWFGEGYVVPGPPSDHAHTGEHGEQD